jgi:hypothetical protein
MHRVLFSTAVLLASVFVAPASAAQLVLDAQAEAGLGAGCRNAEVELAPEVPGAGSARTHSLEIPGRVTLQVEAGTWRITSVAGCWAPVGRIEVAEGAPAQLDLRFRAFGEIAGTFKDRACPAGALAAGLFSRGRGAAPPDLVAERPCRCETLGRWRCEVPAGRWDVRLSAPERAGAYLWDLAIEPAATVAAGSVELKPGASATGFVVAARGRTLPAATRVTISPVGLEPSTARAPSRAGEVLSQGTAPDREGFFQFGSLAPGSYTVSATAPDHAVVQVTIEVSEGREFRLQHPLELSPPATLTLFLDPAVDTGGRPWQISLIEVDARTSTGREVARTVADGSGTAELGGLQPTAHLVRVADGDGNKVSGQTLELSLGHNVHSLELGLVAVEGRVTVGGEPLAATIYYGTRFGSEKVTVRSDPEGDYEAVLPREGPWRIEVDAEDPSVQRRLEKVVEKGRGGRPARVDLELPATRLFGRVVDSEGREVPRATVHVVPVEEGRDNVVWANAAAPDGFEMRGLAAGVYQLQAETRTASSPTYSVSLDESLEREVVLRVEEFVPLRGIVRLDGQPAAGAQVNLWPTQSAMGGGDLFTDAQGRFSDERLVAGTREVFATISAPGRLLWAGRLAVEPGRELVVDLSSAAGELRIDLPEGGWLRMNDWTPVFLYNGVPLGPGTLERWASLGGSPDNGPGRIAALRVAPGVYRACRVPNGEVLPAILRSGGKLRCDEGHLAPGGSLQLTLPKGEGGEKSRTGG